MLGIAKILLISALYYTFYALVFLNPVLIWLLWRKQNKMATTFTAAIQQLTTDVQTLISETGPAAVAAAVAAKDASDAAAVNALDATVKAAITPAPPAS